uniref:Putative salivary kunitz domain protein n=1 Tax=Ixodes ricinus TaxID=34613 RepID=A0A0K8R5B9_IXORI
MKPTMQLILVVSLVIMACIRVDTAGNDKKRKGMAPRCRRPIEEGVCRALYYGRYFFNMTSRNCKKFPYPGCWDKGNAFRDQKTCEKRCKGQK